MNKSMMTHYFMYSRAIHMCDVSDPSVLMTLSAHLGWPVSDRSVKIRAIVALKLSAVSLITALFVHVLLDMREMLTLLVLSVSRSAEMKNKGTILYSNNNVQ